MAKTMYDGTVATQAGAPTITGAGRLLGFMLSHAQAGVQTVTFYDNTAASGTVLLTVSIDPTESPFFVYFPRDQGIPFTTGLSVNDSGANVAIAIWAIGFG
jgi:hypothetical protein